MAKSSKRLTGYQGGRRYSVRHPEHGNVTVFAPSRSDAIVAAAAVWKEEWTCFEFHGFCDVEPVKDGAR